MTFRLASLAFFLASLAVAAVGLTFAPLVLRWIELTRRLAPPEAVEAALLARVRTVLPLYLLLDLLLVAIVCFVILYFTLGRPLKRTEIAIEQMGQLRLDLPLESGGGGPLLSRVRSALRRSADALSREQAVTRQQLRDLREANDRLARAQAELVSAERLATVGRLAAGIAHEVGNPLGGILGYLSLLRSRIADPSTAEFVNHIETEVQRINGIVRGLLDLGRPTSSVLQPIELLPLVHNCVRIGGAGAELKSVGIRIEIPASMVVRSDPGRLSQILLNLLLNAAQAMEGTGEVKISASTVGQYAELRVEDRGPGISPEVLPRLFEPFVTTRAAGQGTGLGLAVSQHLAQGMGGSLRAENAPEGGARFTLTLPLA